MAVEGGPQGMPEAALEYGVLVLRGEGVEQNMDIGTRWLRFAAEHGHPVAQKPSRRMYASGTGAKADPVEAAMWNILAERGREGRTRPWRLHEAADEGAEGGGREEAAAFVVKPSPEFD